MVINETLLPRLYEKTIAVSNIFPYKDFFYYFFVPVIIMFILFIILLLKKRIGLFWEQKKLKFGYIKILFIDTNKQIKIKLVKLDKFNKFEYKKGNYSLEKMQNFVLGYEKNIPIFLYDKNFILPLVVTKRKIDIEIKKQLPTLKTAEISAINMTIEPQILKTVYDKKLLSDLYSISGSSEAFKTKIFWAIIGFTGLIILYYTGYLEKIISYVL